MLKLLSAMLRAFVICKKKVLIRTKLCLQEEVEWGGAASSESMVKAHVALGGSPISVPLAFEHLRGFWWPVWVQPHLQALGGLGLPMDSLTLRDHRASPNPMHLRGGKSREKEKGSHEKLRSALDSWSTWAPAPSESMYNLDSPKLKSLLLTESLIGKWTVDWPRFCILCSIPYYYKEVS